jgi:hypothetical protein
VRLVALLALFALAAACTPRATDCNVNVARELEFAGATVALRAETQGPNCHQAIALYTIRDEAGDLIYAWTTPLQRGFGDVFAAEPDEHLNSFLERWAEPAVLTTASTPAWAELEVGQTTLDQLTYNDIRARELPMLCHYSGTSREACVFWEPAAGAAGHLFDRIAEETPE